MRVRTAVAVLLVLAPWAARAAPPAPLRAGIDRAFPPFEFVDERGEPTGFNVELLRAVAEAVGLEVEFFPGPWHVVREQLEQGRLDLASMVRTAARERLLDFSVPTALLEYAVFVGRDSAVHTLEEARRLGAAAVQAGGVWDEELRVRVPDLRIAPLESAEDVLRAVASGREPTGVLLMQQGLYLARRLGGQPVRSLSERLYVDEMRFAVPAGRAELVSKLNHGILAVHENGRYDALYDRWLGVLRDEGLLGPAAERRLRSAAAVLLGLCLLALLWTRSLRAQVRARTREIEEREAENRALELQVHQSQKLESLGRLAGGIAHDFNNLLTVIIGNASLALGEEGIDERLGGRIERIRTAGEAGARLTHQLLEFARTERVEPRTLGWNQLIRDSQEMLERPLGAAVTVHLDLAEDLWPVRIDPGQALQVLMNLVLNARDAIAQRGSVWIETANFEEGGRRWVRLSVRDDGAGMDDEVRKRIFEPFFTTRRDGGGTGLGLATVWAIVARSGGRIDVESRLGAGSRFDVVLPRDAERGPEGRLETAERGRAGEPPRWLSSKPLDSMTKKRMFELSSDCD